MITPTGATVTQYWDAIKAKNPAYAKITFANGVELDNDDIEQEGIVITDILNGSIDLAFGYAVMKSLEMRILDSNKLSSIAWGSEFTLEIGVEISGSINWVTVGIFSGSKPERYPVNGVVEYTATDRMRLFDVPCETFLRNTTFPITFSNLYHNLCNYVGIQYEAGNELPNIMSRSISSGFIDSFTGSTCRDLLGKMAEACGCYAKITSAGKVKMVWFNDQSSYSVTADQEFSLSALNIDSAKTWEDLEIYTWADLENFTWDDLTGWDGIFRIEALSVKTYQDDVGVIVPGSTDGYIYYILDNPFLYTNNSTEVTNYITPIYNRLSAFGGYLPMSVECTGNWLVESGDIITVDFNGEQIKLPLFSRTLRWSGTSCTDTYEATGRLEREAMATPTHEKMSQMGRFHEIKRTIDGNYENIQDQFGNYYTKSETASYVTTKMTDTLGNYYTKTETASYVSTQMTDTLGNYYTKSETASYVTLQLGDYYGKVSGITITASGVDITGSKYVRVAAETNRRWLYDSNGLTYVDTSTNTNLLGFGQLANSSSAASRVGVFYDKSGEPNSGRLFLRVSSKWNNQWYQNGIKIDCEFLGQYINNANVIVSPYYDSEGVKYVGGGAGVSGSILLAPSMTYIDKAAEIFYQATDNSLWLVSDAVSKFYFMGTVAGGSSRDIKHDIAPIEDVGSIIDNLQPVSFVYDNDVAEKKQFGLIYEDTVDVIPEICITQQARDGEQKAIDYVMLVPILLKEIQSLRARIKSIEEMGA